jgi:hypothetical protein
VENNTPIYLQDVNDAHNPSLPPLFVPADHDAPNLFENRDREEDPRPTPSRKKVIYKMSNKERCERNKWHNVLLQKMSRTKPNAKYSSQMRANNVFTK